MQVRIAILAALLGICAAVPSAAKNSGLDRLTYRSELLGWEAVGKVKIGRSGYCTGTLIARDLVLTAAHCVYRGGRLVEPSGLVFQAGLRDGKVVASSKVLRIFPHADYKPKQGPSEFNIRYDVALMKLASPIPTNLASPFQVVQSAFSGSSVSVVSYARSRSDALSWQKKCGVLAQKSELYVFSCNVEKGSSGAPVFVKEQGRRRIVSIISSGNTSGSDSVAFGMDLRQRVAEIKAVMRGPRTLSGGPSEVRILKPSANRSGTGALFLKP